MKFTSALTLLSVILINLSAISLVTAAPIYTTSLMFESTHPDPLSDELVLEWSTDNTMGVVSASDLIYWKMTLLNDSAIVYEDSIITNSNVNSIGGVARSIGDIVFSFNLDAFFNNATTGLLNFDNDYPVLQNGNAIGTTFNIYQVGHNGIDLDQRFNGGNFQSGAVVLFNQSTSVPAPATLALLVLGLFSICWVKRRM